MLIKQCQRDDSYLDHARSMCHDYFFVVDMTMEGNAHGHPLVVEYTVEYSLQFQLRRLLNSFLPDEVSPYLLILEVSVFHLPCELCNNPRTYSQLKSNQDS